MKRPSPKNISTLLVCVGPVLSALAYAIAFYFAHSSPREPFPAQGDFYENAAIFCVTLFLGGLVVLLVGLSMKTFLFCKRMYDKNKLLITYWKK